MVTNKNVHGKLFFWNTLHHKQHYTWQPRSANVTHESVSLQNQIQVTDAPFLPKFTWAISETLCEPLPPSTKLPDNLLYDLAIISVLDLRGKKKKKKWRERTRDVGMSVYRTGSASGAMGCRDLVVWPLLRALWMSSSIFIDLLWLMSPATSKIKLQRSHTSQEGRKRAGKSEAENEWCRGSERSW